MHTDELVISEAPVPIHGSPIIPGSASNSNARSELLSSQEDSLNKSLDKPAAAPDNKHDDDKLELEQQQEEHKTTGTPAPAQDKPNKTCDACQILKGHENNAADTSVHTNVNANAASAVSVLKSIHSNTSATPSSPTVVQGQAQEGQNRDHNLNPSSSASASASAAPGSDSSPARQQTEPGQSAQDIIPLPAKTAPHHLKQLPLPSAPPLRSTCTCIKATPSPSSREAAGGEHDPSTIAVSPSNSTNPNMIFSDLYKSPRSPLSKLRNSFPHAIALPPDVDADLVSKDKARQKEAVKRFLTEKIRNDWDFVWPPPSVSSSPPTETTTTTTSSHEHEQQQQRDNAIPANSAAPTTQDDSRALAQDDGSLGTTTAPSPDVAVDFDEDAPRDPGEEADSESGSDAESVYSTMSEDQEHFRPRAEWTSDLSDSEEPAQNQSPFRFDSPDAVGSVVRSSILAKRTRRRRAVREEASWNPGLACFVARRDAWTGAKTVRVKPKPASPVSPTSTRRLSFWKHHHRSESAAAAIATGLNMGTSPPAATSPISPTATRTSHNSDLAAITPPVSEPDSNHKLTQSTSANGAAISHSTSCSSHESTTPNALYPVETLLPLPPPLLPPQNPMRASVTPAIYPSLYDKIVVHNLQPSCPVNLADMLRACVVGWKRDGEWPPKPTMAPMPTAAELAAVRRQKAAQQAAMQKQRDREAREARDREEKERQERERLEKQHARKGSTASIGANAARRLSFVGFLSGGGPGYRVEKEKKQQQQESNEAGNGEPLHTSHSGGGSDSGGGGGAGKGIRRSLQKVFSLGHGHGHHHSTTTSTPAPPVI